jgi:hypothetical protein
MEERRDGRARLRGYSKSTNIPAGASTDIPPFEQHGFDLTSDQERFFDQWKRRWEQGKAVDLGCTVGYLYTNDHLYSNCPDDVIAQIPRLLSPYRGVSKNFTSFCQRWISDHYLLNGRYKRALREYLELKLGVTATHVANKRLNFKRLVGVPVRAADLFAMVGPNLTEWSESNISAVASDFESFLEMIEKESGASLLVTWLLGKQGQQWPLFSYTGIEPKNRAQSVIWRTSPGCSGKCWMIGALPRNEPIAPTRCESSMLSELPRL